MTVVTRFAPSPTGFLHIGGARTALFNWLFARHHGGAFRLRIEDTDRARSTQAAVDAILDGLQWLGLDWDGEVVHQFARAERHREVAEELLARGQAYRCYATAEELSALRAEGKPYDRRWRDAVGVLPPEGVSPAIRLKAPLDRPVALHDHIRGEVVVPPGQLEDLVILRSDGNPTYNLAVVADDHDMGVTHIIRGEDHLTNAAKQQVMYEALGWDVPEFAHIPLIHGADGAKLSKRHGALGVEAYRDMGYLPEALRNYLLRLGWAHGDEEIIQAEQAIKWFSLRRIGASPSRFDMTKLDHVNGHYLREAEDARLVELIVPLLETKGLWSSSPAQQDCLRRGMKGLKSRARTLVELAGNAAFYLEKRPIPVAEKARALLTPEAGGHLQAFAAILARAQDWTEAALQDAAKAYAEAQGMKLGQIAQPLRAALTGDTVSPGIFEVMEALGREETLGRIGDAANA